MKWIWDEVQQKLVEYDSYRPPERALDAPIMMDRFYENTVAPDGSDIGSRRKHREYMRANGLTTADDYKQTWQKAAEKREAAREGHVPDPRRREAIERAMYRMNKP